MKGFTSSFNDSTVNTSLPSTSKSTSTSKPATTQSNSTTTSRSTQNKSTNKIHSTTTTIKTTTSTSNRILNPVSIGSKSLSRNNSITSNESDIIMGEINSQEQIASTKRKEQEVESQISDLPIRNSKKSKGGKPGDGFNVSLVTKKRSDNTSGNSGIRTSNSQEKGKKKEVNNIEPIASTSAPNVPVRMRTQEEIAEMVRIQDQAIHQLALQELDPQRTNHVYLPTSFRLSEKVEPQEQPTYLDYIPAFQHIREAQEKERQASSSTAPFPERKVPREARMVTPTIKSTPYEIKSLRKNLNIDRIPIAPFVVAKHHAGLPERSYNSNRPILTMSSQTPKPKVKKLKGKEYDRSSSVVDEEKERSHPFPSTSKSTINKIIKSSPSSSSPPIKKLPTSLSSPVSGRRKTAIEKRQPRLVSQLKSTDWSIVDPRFLNSLLFRIEYLSHGNLTYAQSKPNQPPRQYLAPTGNLNKKKMSDKRPSWEKWVDVKMLAKRLNEDEFILPVWGRDLFGSQASNEAGMEEKEWEGVRPFIIQGMDMYLMGKEFPLKSVMLVGYVVGIKVKEASGGNLIIHSVDDGTAVIECKCYAQGTKREIHIKVGMLVRLTGLVEKEDFDSALQINVNKIAELKDSNLEWKHHLLVEQSHREVYSQALDLKTKMLVLRAEEKNWQGSQASSSEAGTPKKPKPLLHPKRLDPEDLQSNFLPYIKNFLRTHHINSIDPNPPTSQNTNFGAAPYALIGTSLEATREIPIEFTLTDLESNGLLRDFAYLLAQKNEKDRLRKKGKKVLTVKATASWNAKTEGDIFRSNPPGWKNSGATILAGPTSRKPSRSNSKGKGKDVSNSITEDDEDDQPLEGDALLRAAHLLFRKALVELRTTGHIVLAVPDELEQLESAAENDNNFELQSIKIEPSSPAAYDPQRINKTTHNLFQATETYNGHDLSHFVTGPRPSEVRRGNAPWELIDIQSSPEKPPRQPFDGWQEMSSVTPKAKTKTKTVTESDSNAPWELRDASPSPSPPPQSRTPRPPKNQLLDQLNLPLPPSPSTSKKPTLFRVSKGSDDSRTDSVYEIEMEAWVLVTPYFLNQPLLKIIEDSATRVRHNNNYQRSLKEKSDKAFEVEGTSEFLLTKILKTDARWECVAGNDLIMDSAVEDLIERNKIMRSGTYLVLVDRE